MIDEVTYISYYQGRNSGITVKTWFFLVVSTTRKAIIMSSNLVDTVQSVLDDNDVRDVKFFFSQEAGFQRLSEVKENVAYILDAFFKGQHAPLSPIGDSKK